MEVEFVELSEKGKDKGLAVNEESISFAVTF